MSDSNAKFRTQLQALIPRLRRLALVLRQGSTGAADDLTAAVLDCAWASAARLRRRTRLDLWLFKQAIQLWRLDPAHDRDAPPSPTDERGAPASLARLAVACLPAEQRAAVALMVIERLNAAAAGDILGLPADRAAALNARARRNLDGALRAGARAEGAA
jgi:RNA polymerase sigma-70 factor (ECF subfamily)